MYSRQFQLKKYGNFHFEKVIFENKNIKQTLSKFYLYIGNVMFTRKK